MQDSKSYQPPTQPREYNPASNVDRTNHALRAIDAAIADGHPLSRTEIAVLRHIAHRDQGTGEGCYESMTGICRYTGLERHAVGRAIQGLAKRELIWLAPGLRRSRILHFVHPSA